MSFVPDTILDEDLPTIVLRLFGYRVSMAHELDDIRAQANCPVCKHELNVSYKTMRLGLTIECPSCGETIRPIDDTPMGKIQGLIDEA
jgi:C4-type Zn-finger protein